MIRPFINRSGTGAFEMPADGWVHIIPLGEYPVTIETEAGKRTFIQVIDEKALDSIANRFAPDAGNILVDEEHFSYDPSKSSRAFAWVDAVRKQADGMWGKLRLTDIGTPAVTNGQYRFVSPVWLPKDTEMVGPGKIRPLRLDSLGLTNNPNLRGMAPLSNRAGSAPAWLADGDPADNATSKQNMNSVIMALGLQAGSSEEVVASAVRALTNRATSAEQSLATLKTDHTALEKKLGTLLDAQIEADLSPLVNRAPAPVIETYRVMLRNDRPAALPAVEAYITALSGPTPAGAKAPLVNRKAAKTPEGAAPQGGDDNTAKAENLIKDYQIRNRCSYQEANDYIVTQHPELFVAFRGN